VGLNTVVHKTVRVNIRVLSLNNPLLVENYTKYDVFIGDFVSYSTVYYDFNNCVLGN